MARILNLVFSFFVGALLWDTAIGCHVNGHNSDDSTPPPPGIGLESLSSSATTQKSAANNLSVSIFFSTCLKRIVPHVNWDWSSVSSYVVYYSEWYDSTSNDGCSPFGSVNRDTAECWSQALPTLLRGESQLIPMVKECIDAYVLSAPTINAIATGYTGNGLLSEVLGSASNFVIDLYVSIPETTFSRTTYDKNNVRCPVRTPQEYTQCVDAVLSSDDTELDFNSVASFLEEEGTCQNAVDCECSTLYSEDSDIVAYYENEAIRCGDCWATELSGTFAKRSNVANIKDAITQCSGLTTQYEEALSESVAAPDSEATP